VLASSSPLRLAPAARSLAHPPPPPRPTPRRYTARARHCAHAQPKASWRCGKVYDAKEEFEDAAVHFWEGYNHGKQKSKAFLLAFKDSVRKGREKVGAASGPIDLPPGTKS
jgi:hypothetical protein